MISVRSSPAMKTRGCFSNALCSLNFTELGSILLRSSMDKKVLPAAEALKRPTCPWAHVMRLGLGTGSTAKHFVAGLGEKCAAGLDVRCVPTSEETRKQAEGLNIPLSNLDELGGLDLTVDGADEMDEFISKFRQKKYKQ